MLCWKQWLCCMQYWVILGRFINAYLGMPNIQYPSPTNTLFLWGAQGMHLSWQIIPSIIIRAIVSNIVISLTQLLMKLFLINLLISLHDMSWSLSHIWRQNKMVQGVRYCSSRKVTLTHWGRVTHIAILVYWVNWTVRNYFHWNWKQNSTIVLPKMSLKMLFAK